jgi:hypothetical protein
MGRLREIQEQMLELLDEAKRIVSSKRKTHRMTYERMKAYWHGHIQMALTNEHDYLGSGGATMLEAVEEIEGTGDSVDDLENYAGDRIDAEDLRPEIENTVGDLPPDLDVAEIIRYALEEAGMMDADEIRAAIDKAAEKANKE